MSDSPITRFPVPEGGDGADRVYVSVGHQQMMTDAMKPLGLSVWKLTTPRPMVEAGSRLFVDVTDALAAASSRAELLGVFARSDPLVTDALRSLIDRGDVVPSRPDDGPGEPILPARAGDLLEADPAIVTGLIERTEASVAALRRDIRAISGPALFEFVLADIGELRRLLFDPSSSQVVMAGMEAAWWLDDHLREWLGEPDAADVLAQSVPHNVTSQMGLALLDVADVVRPHGEVVAFLREVADDGFLDQLAGLPGGTEVRRAIDAYLDRYGMRCVGEIDITRPRWSEQPSALVPLILANVENFEAGEAARRFERGRHHALEKEREVLARLRELAGGDRKAGEAKGMIDRVRAFAGYREHPKYGMVCRYFAYKRALLGEAEQLVRAGLIDEVEDIFFLTFEELHDVVRTGRLDGDLVAHRRAQFRAHEALTPPRVLTSAGEAFTGDHRRAGVPAGALAGSPVCAGLVEGRARVVLDIADADLAPGDILVTVHTDPSWSPLFVVASGLVTEVGGMMTHGAVVAREYGLPAVVGVEHATRRIADGQRIRLDGSTGYVEVLP